MHVGELDLTKFESLFYKTMTSLLASSPLVLTYLDLLPVGGRGGVTRFFLLSHEIPFEERLFALHDDSWKQEKERLIASGENPSGSVPILYCNGQSHPGHIASIRYLARIHQLDSGDAHKDFVQDFVTDEYNGFRDQWVKVTFSGNEDDKVNYKSGFLIQQLIKFDALYDKFRTHDVFLSVSAKTSRPLWGDAAIFGLLRDNILTKYLTLDDLAAYPRLLAMYQAYADIPAIKEWIDSVDTK